MDDGRPGPAAWTGMRSAVPALLALFLVSRLLLLLAAAVIEATIPLDYRGPEFSDRPILGALTGTDAIYYLGIAEDGYHVEPVKEQYVDWVFFPLYPIAVKLAALPLGGDVALAGVLVANVAMLGAMFVLYALARPRLGDEAALRSVGLAALAPGAVAFAMAYSDSLLLLLIAGAVLAGEHRRWPLAGLLYGLAALTRPPGVLFGLPLAAILLAQRGPKPSLQWLWLAAGPIAIVGFMAYQGAVLGDPLAFVHAQNLWNIPTALETPAEPGQASGVAGSIVPLVGLLFAILLAYTALIPRFRRSDIPSWHILVALVAFATVFLSGRLQSDARYLAIGWPFAWLIASRSSPAVRDLWTMGFAGLYVLLAFLHITQALAP